MREVKLLKARVCLVLVTTWMQLKAYAQEGIFDIFPEADLFCGTGLDTDEF